jgi:hypothetical protein
MTHALKALLRISRFGVKVQGLEKAASYLHSADSMAWSYGARKGKVKMPECVAAQKNHINCANCSVYAKHWLHTLVQPAIDKGTKQINSSPPTKKSEQETAFE